MATIYNEDIIDIELTTGTVSRNFANHVIGYGDEYANRYGVRVFRNGEPVQLTGTCRGYFIRNADEVTVMFNGYTDANKAWVVLPENCYLLEGGFTLAIKIINDSENATLRIVDGTVARTSTNAISDPESIIPSVDYLLRRIEEAEASIPEDYSALCTALRYEGKAEETMIPASLYTIKGILKGDGTGVSNVGNYYTTPYIPILCQDLYFKGGFFPVTAYNTFCLYDAGQNVIMMARGDMSVNVADYPTAAYFRASMDTTDPQNPDYWTKVGNKRSLHYINQMIGIFGAGVPTPIPDERYFTQGLISPDGTDIDNSFAAAHNYYTTDYIELPDEANLFFSGGFFPSDAYNTFCLYDESKDVVRMGRGDETIALSDYPTAKYMRASSDIASGKSFSVRISSTDPRKGGMVFHLGSGQTYTTLRTGIAEAIKYPSSVVYVHPGTYDLTSEFAAEISAATGGATGIILGNNVHVIFMAASYVKALFPTSSAWINTYFNPFRGHDFKLEGLNIEASNCRYCVHDENAGYEPAYHNVYQDCVMKMTANGTVGTYGQCIGGGLGKHGFIEIKGGKYESFWGAGNPTISYHNGSVSGADSKFFIRDLYVGGEGGFFRFGYWGPSTIKTPIYISGCSMGAAISKGPETQDSVNDNFEIIEWNNIIRS